MKIIHKGLILVGVPLVFGITFVSVLFWGISDANRIFQHELLLKDAMITDNVTTRSSFAAKICAMSYLFTRQKVFKDRLNSNMKEAESSYKKLQTLLKNEPAVKIPAKISRKEIITGDASYLIQMNAFMQKLERMADKETASALKSMNWLQAVLIGGVLGSTVITIALAVFFCLNITSRLLMIMNNTMNLSSGRPLNPPLKGTDEIAELDQFLFKSAREIRELERFKQEMVGVVSHELKSPLSSVEMFLYSLSAGVFGELNVKAKDKVLRTHQNVLQLMSLVKELLYLDRLELNIQPETIKGQDVVKIAIDSAKEVSDQLKIKVVIKELDGTLFADRNRIVQVIVNLLSNAVKSSPPEGEVTIETREIDGWFECRVSDKGRGIPDEIQNQVFEPFKQIITGNESNKKGTGLGLTIARSIVNQHGGQIGVESAEGNGNTFWFKVPSRPERKTESKARDNSYYSFDPSAKTQDDVTVPLRIPTKDLRVGRFSLLKQGLIIISVPLIFQFGFVSVIGGLLYHIQQHAHREEQSKEILNTLNRIEQEIVVASHFGVMYIFSHDPSYLRSWQNGKQNAMMMIEKLSSISVQDSAQQQNINETKLSFQVASTVLEDLMVRKQGNGKPEITLLEAARFSNFSNLQSMINSSGAAQIVKPILKGLEVQKMIMRNEREIGERLSVQRSEMIGTAQLALGIGFVLNIGLSICLALFLVRNITGRLQHVNQNMERLLQRAALEPPQKGSDEIAYLDQMLYETGNHLVELETFKRELISIVSHELRTPLLSVSSTLELLASGTMGELSAKGQNRLKIAQEEANRLIRLINDLLDIEKMEAGKFVLNISEVKISDMLNASIEAVAPLADLKGIRLESIPINNTLYADRDRISQVLINLLSNAIKFSPNDSKVIIEADVRDENIEFRVIDRGRGIPEELKERIFDRFVQVENSDAIERGGTGLGLAIAKAIIEQHAGTLGVQSQLGKGSTFWFKLPNTLKPNHAQIAQNAKSASITLSASRGHRGLIQQPFVRPHANVLSNS